MFLFACNVINFLNPPVLTGPLVSKHREDNEWMCADETTARLSLHKLTFSRCQQTITICITTWSPAHLCPDHLAGEFFREVNTMTMAVFLSAHWTPTVSKVFASFFIWKALLFFKSFSYHLQILFFFFSETHTRAVVFQGPWLRDLPL